MLRCTLAREATIVGSCMVMSLLADAWTVTHDVNPDLKTCHCSMLS